MDVTINYCYSFERLSDEGEEKDQVVPEVFAFVVCLFNMGQIRGHVYTLR